jgi:hypothetical protein
MTYALSNLRKMMKVKEISWYSQKKKI